MDVPKCFCVCVVTVTGLDFQTMLKTAAVNFGVYVNDFHYTVVQPAEAAQSTARRPCMDPRPPCTVPRLPCMVHGLPCMDPRLQLMAMVRLKQYAFFVDTSCKISCN